MEQINVDAGLAGQRLDKLLRKFMPLAGSGFLYKMLRKKNITLNDKKAGGSEIIREGDVVKLFFSDETIDKLRGAQEEGFREEKRAYTTLKGVKVLYEDEHALIVHKPAGILSQKAVAGDISLNEWLIGYLLQNGKLTAGELAMFRPSVCNRLDRNTSGIVLCGKSLKGSRQLSFLIRSRGVRKFYRTLVWGRLDKERRLEGYLRKDKEKNRVYISPDPDPQDEGAAICTVYRPLSVSVLDTGKERWEITCLEVELITGKSHQIRAHLSSVGHSLLGDGKYACRGAAEKNAYLKRRYNIEYQMLHSQRLEFPTTSGEPGEWDGLVIEAPLPKQFEILTGGC